jgi:hypothetical protein
VKATILRLFAAAAILAVPLGAADAGRGAFGVGVLRRDGVIIPFAAWDGRRWSAPWPPPASDLTVPITLDAVPKGWWGPTPPLSEWQAWTAADTRTVRAAQPEWLDVHCQRQIGLRTDYVAGEPPPPRVVQPYPKDGLVVSPAQPIERIEIISPDAPETRALIPALLESFNKAERDLEEESGHPIPRRAREGIEPTIEAVYAIGGAASRVYYVESSRRYRQLGTSPDECDALAFGAGWFVRDTSSVRPVVATVGLLRCDRVGASYMLPLGVVRISNRLFWIAQFSGWDHERFVVLEVKPRRIDVMLNIWGGGC